MQEFSPDLFAVSDTSETADPSAIEPQLPETIDPALLTVAPMDLAIASSSDVQAVAVAAEDDDEAAGSMDFNVDMLDIDHLDHDPDDPEVIMPPSIAQWKMLEEAGLVKNTGRLSQAPLPPPDLKEISDDMPEDVKEERLKHNADEKEAHDERRKERNKEAARRSRGRRLELADNLLRLNAINTRLIKKLKKENEELRIQNEELKTQNQELKAENQRLDFSLEPEISPQWSSQWPSASQLDHEYPPLFQQ